jgi:hypothetical protein
MYLNNNPILLEQFKRRLGILSTGSQGTISLQHDLYEGAVAVAPTCINEILAIKTVTPMPVSECVGDMVPYTDSKFSIPLSMSLPREEYVASSGVIISPGSGVKKNNSARVSSVGSALIYFVIRTVTLLFF